MTRLSEEISVTDPNLDPETWFDQYGDYLYRFALSRIKDQGVAEDLVQETFLAALRGRKSFKGRSPPLKRGFRPFSSTRLWTI